jgi:hypothetical protein
MRIPDPKELGQQTYEYRDGSNDIIVTASQMMESKEVNSGLFYKIIVGAIALSIRVPDGAASGGSLQVPRLWRLSREFDDLILIRIVAYCSIFVTSDAAGFAINVGPVLGWHVHEKNAWPSFRKSP